MPPQTAKPEKKKKKGTALRPWCWYCERDFEDVKILMQHQKAKHFKCNHCPRRLNTAGGLAVHVQQVHKLEPDPIENALPGRDGYDVEIFGMEGIPAPDLADYKRRKETELGLAPGSTSAPPAAKRPKIDKRVMTQQELATMLTAHKALMSGSELPLIPGIPPPAAMGASVSFGAPVPFPMLPPGMQPPPGFQLPPGMPGPPVPGAVPGMPFPPLSGPFPPPGMPGAPPMPFPPGAMPPPGMLPPGMMPPGGPPFGYPGGPAPPAMSGLPPGSLPPPPATPTFAPVQKTEYARPPEIKGGAKLVWAEADMSPEEHRAKARLYSAPFESLSEVDGPRGVKRVRAEDFL